MARLRILAGRFAGGRASIQMRPDGASCAVRRSQIRRHEEDRAWRRSLVGRCISTGAAKTDAKKPTSFSSGANLKYSDRLRRVWPVASYGRVAARKGSRHDDCGRCPMT